MEQKKVTRDFKVLTEKISPDNVAVMAGFQSPYGANISGQCSGNGGTHSHARDQSAHRIL